jgi:hypothetical protein
MSHCSARTSCTSDCQQHVTHSVRPYPTTAATPRLIEYDRNGADAASHVTDCVGAPRYILLQRIRTDGFAHCVCRCKGCSIPPETREPADLPVARGAMVSGWPGLPTRTSTPCLVHGKRRPWWTRVRPDSTIPIVCNLKMRTVNGQINLDLGRGSLALDLDSANLAGG